MIDVRSHVIFGTHVFRELVRVFDFTYCVRFSLGYGGRTQNK